TTTPGTSSPIGRRPSTTPSATRCSAGSSASICKGCLDRKMEKRLEILDLPQDVRALVGECELTGNQTVFTRNGRAVVTLISHDEYIALHETLEIANDPALRSQIEAAESE